MTAPATELRDSVGPYRLIRAIGAGGSARIDLARIDRAYNFQRHVVVKRPLEHLRGDRNVAASLRREARIGGRLRHPNLVAVLDAGEHDGYDYLVLEYIHGASLRTLMQHDLPHGQVREVPIAVALGIAIDIARGLHEAHELRDDRGAPLGLVHRDVSPGNVLLGLDGSVKVADFGIAKETRVATLSGSMHGTVTYMAPEQCRGHAFDRRADVFSLGVILHELLTGQRLFWADNDVASLHRVLSGEVPEPRKLRPELSQTLSDVVMAALAHDPDKRFMNARALGDALEGLAASEGHVLGARWLARTLEEVVGARHVPWVAATTMIDLPRTSEPSLVAVIESAPEVEPALPTFGPRHERTGEEGTIPPPPRARSASVPPPAPARRRTLGLVVAGGVLVGVALAVGASLMLERGREPAAPPPVSARVPDPPAPAPARVEPAPVAPVAAAVAPPAPPAAAEPTPTPPPPQKRHLRKPHPGAAPAPVAPAPPPPAPAPAPPPAAPAHTDVPWTQHMFTPPSTGSGSAQ
ncbi:MAG TPA: serine/threonine-protein kinase [Kofleriaceae bacterium]|nr:serine/threonine-protein kinase [Kofleriaceae bacterium]